MSVRKNHTFCINTDRLKMILVGRSAALQSLLFDPNEIVSGSSSSAKVC